MIGNLVLFDFYLSLFISNH